MPRRQTINPLHLHTGEHVFVPVTQTDFLKDGNTVSKFDFKVTIIKFLVTEKMEVIKAIDPKKSLREFKFVLSTDMIDAVCKRFITNEKCPFFRTVKACEEWMLSEIRGRARGLREHEDRQEDYFEAKLVEKDLT